LQIGGPAPWRSRDGNAQPKVSRVGQAVEIAISEPNKS